MVFIELKLKLGEFEVDMFVFRLNYKMFCYIVWGLDFGVVVIDVFIIDWFKYNLIYCFFLFSFIGKVF